ncbi:MAG: hypothetical protein KAI84_06730 [Gammaproteobacteria bacterium]|nr:hypothetical protein [Gammaproteobacteria bacterium]
MDRIKDVGKAKKFGKTLREQNQARRCIDSKSLKGLESFFCRVDKFTIVELLFNGKRYHGLTAKSDQDITNATEGVALAYKRAFDEMVEDQGLIENLTTSLFKGLNSFQSALGNTVAAMVRSEEPIGVGIVMTYGVCKLRCINCRRTAEYSLTTMTPQTRCPHCNEPVISKKGNARLADIPISVTVGDAAKILHI